MAHPPVDASALAFAALAGFDLAHTSCERRTLPVHEPREELIVTAKTYANLDEGCCSTRTIRRPLAQLDLAKNYKSTDDTVYCETFNVFTSDKSPSSRMRIPPPVCRA